MFGKKKHLQDSEYEEPIRNKPDRKLFGFHCSRSLHLTAKVLAKKLHVDLWVVAEHALELGLMDVASALKDPQETEFLREHLNERHIIPRLAESVGKYDEEAAGYIREGQVRQYHKEKAIRGLVELWSKYGLDPLLMREIILGELKKVTEFMRTRAAQRGHSARNTQNPSDTIDETNKGSGEE